MQHTLCKHPYLWRWSSHPGRARVSCHSPGCNRHRRTLGPRYCSYIFQQPPSNVKVEVMCQKQSYTVLKFGYVFVKVHFRNTWTHRTVWQETRCSRTCMWACPNSVENCICTWNTEKTWNFLLMAAALCHRNKNRRHTRPTLVLLQQCLPCPVSFNET